MTRRSTTLLTALLFALALGVLSQGATGGLLASVQDGLNAIVRINIPQGNPRVRVVQSLQFLVTFLALAAVIAIIAAGAFFIVGAGSDTAIQRGRKIIVYTIVGLLVIFFAAVIVGFFTVELPT